MSKERADINHEAGDSLPTFDQLKGGKEDTIQLGKNNIQEDNDNITEDINVDEEEINYSTVGGGYLTNGNSKIAYIITFALAATIAIILSISIIKDFAPSNIPASVIRNTDDMSKLDVYVSESSDSEINSGKAEWREKNLREANKDDLNYFD